MNTFSNPPSFAIDTHWDAPSSAAVNEALVRAGLTTSKPTKKRYYWVIRVRHSCGDAPHVGASDQSDVYDDLPIYSALTQMAEIRRILAAGVVSLSP